MSFLKNWKQTSDTWELAPNPYYYDKKKVKLTQVDGSTIKEDNTGINLYQTGDLDLTKISGQFVSNFLRRMDQNKSHLHWLPHIYRLLL